MAISPQVREFYNGYEPPIYVLRTVKVLLESVPQNYVRGLDCVVLTNQSGMARRNQIRKMKSRGRRLTQAQTLGFYQPTWSGKRPWIELHVDKITAVHHEFSEKHPYYHHEFTFGTVLFHEIGHHIHATIGREFREKEDVADDWSRKLLADYFRLKYGLVMPANLL